MKLIILLASMVSIATAASFVAHGAHGITPVLTKATQTRTRLGAVKTRVGLAGATRVNGAIGEDVAGHDVDDDDEDADTERPVIKQSKGKDPKKDHAGDDDNDDEQEEASAPVSSTSTSRKNKNKTTTKHMSTTLRTEIISPSTMFATVTETEVETEIKTHFKTTIETTTATSVETMTVSETPAISKMSTITSSAAQDSPAPPKPTIFFPSPRPTNTDDEDSDFAHPPHNYCVCLNNADHSTWSIYARGDWTANVIPDHGEKLLERMRSCAKLSTWQYIDTPEPSKKLPGYDFMAEASFEDPACECASEVLASFDMQGECEITESRPMIVAAVVVE